MSKDLSELLLRIRGVVMPDVFNPWTDRDELDDDTFRGGPNARVARLSLHFERTPRFLLVGEAPGYQGCHFSGVPFTNERLIVDDKVPGVPAVRFTKRVKPWSEPSATVVWGTLHELGIAADVVMWNAFAWHPHEPGDVYTNRTPTRAEFVSGAHVLDAVVRHFPTAAVVAIGNKSRDLLSSLGVFCSGHVRHPSMGGANQFREGMKRLVSADASQRETLSIT